MKRREFIALVGAAAVARPLAARAQPPKQIPRIGVLLFGDEEGLVSFVHAFETGMAERGYQDGKNVRFEVRYSDRNLEKMG